LTNNKKLINTAKGLSRAFVNSVFRIIFAVSSNYPFDQGCLIIQKSGESGLSETLATIRLLAGKVPIPGRKRNYNLNTAFMRKFLFISKTGLFLLSFMHFSDMCM